jgi:hypothetical protein
MTPAECNRAKAPDFADVVDKLRALYGAQNVKVAWLRTPDGECIGPVPAEIAADPLHGVKP